MTMTQMIIKIAMKHWATVTPVDNRPTTTRGIKVIKRADIQQAREMMPVIEPVQSGPLMPPRRGLIVDKADAIRYLGGMTLCD